VEQGLMLKLFNAARITIIPFRKAVLERIFSMFLGARVMTV
jgi:hypothetical protein